jgi:hypothetical protein
MCAHWWSIATENDSHVLHNNSLTCFVINYTVNIFISTENETQNNEICEASCMYVP